MWTAEQRQAHARDGLRYPSDLTDAEWALVEPLIPPAKRGGRQRTVVVREVLNGIFYILATGCQWRALPKDLPPKSTVYDYLTLWTWDGTLRRLHHALFVQAREQAGKVLHGCSSSMLVADAHRPRSTILGGAATPVGSPNHSICLKLLPLEHALEAHAGHEQRGEDGHVPRAGPSLRSVGIHCALLQPETATRK